MFCYPDERQFRLISSPRANDGYFPPRQTSRTRATLNAKFGLNTTWIVCPFLLFSFSFSFFFYINGAHSPSVPSKFAREFDSCLYIIVNNSRLSAYYNVTLVPFSPRVWDTPVALRRVNISKESSFINTKVPSKISLSYRAF